jgi:hypothetical protein
MSITIGGFIPQFSFKLNKEPAANKIIATPSSGVSTGRVIDCILTNVILTGQNTGSQFLVQAVPERFNTIGQNPNVILSTDNTGIATIDISGNVSYISAGQFKVIGTSNAVSYYPARSLSLDIINISGAPITNYSFFTPDPIDISKHVLIIYNTNSNDSINLKNYYTGIRPLFYNSNILGISCPSGQEIVSYTTFTGSIRQPIINYLTGVSGTKPIRYAVMMCDIPTRVSDTVTYSVPYQLYLAYDLLGLRNGVDYNHQPNHFNLAQYQRNTFLSSYINFGSYKDSTSYIDKISAGQTGIYLKGNGLNTGYFIEDAGGYSVFPTYFSGRNYEPLTGQFPTINVVYRANAQSHITTGDNLAGYCSWGTDGGLGNMYANDGTIKWGGNSNWYILLTVDSFNGDRIFGGGQCCFINWFSSGAFGGTGYNNCPVGAIGNVEEPGLFTSCDSGYFNLWQSGYPFIECAWQSRGTPYFAAFGDPLIIKS